MGEREIHARRRPILRVVRLINGLLREFAIYYLAATAAHYAHYIGKGSSSIRIEAKRSTHKKTINYFLFGAWTPHVAMMKRSLKLLVGRRVIVHRSGAVGRSMFAGCGELQHLTPKQ